MQNEIRNDRGEKLDYTFHAGDPDGDVVVVIGHGVTGNKDRALVVALAEGLSRAGVAALRFSFAGNGDSEGDFRDATISKEVGDLGAVLDALDGRTVYYVGHSMGAAVGVLRASRDARIRALVSLAGMVHTAKFAETEFGSATPDAGCMWDDPDCPLSSAYMRDMKEIGSVLDRAARITIPWLLVHGTADDVVPYQESRDIIAISDESRTLVTIPDGGHVFDGDALEPMVAEVVDWLQAPGKSGKSQ